MEQLIYRSSVSTPAHRIVTDYREILKCNCKSGKSHQKSRSKFKVKVTRSKISYHVKGLVIRNTHVKYESPTSYDIKVIANVKVFQK